MSAVALEATTLDIQALAAAAHGELRGAPPSIAGVSIDSRSIAPGEMFAAIAGPRFDGHDFVAEAASRGAVAALVHRDVDAPPGLALVRVADTTRALADMARHVRSAAGVPVVAITGSTGKTTTKEMTAGLLAGRGPVLRTRGNLNNQWGLPVTLLRLRPEHTAAVLELGMSSAGELRLLTDIARPDVAAVTNVAAVHLEFFDSVDAIARAKAEILEGLAADGSAVLNGDDPRVRAMAEGLRQRVVWFGRNRRFDVSAENWRGTVHGSRFDLRVAGLVVDVALPLPGPHFVTNLLAAAACAHALGVPATTIAERAASLVAAPRRGEVHRLGDGVTLIDDSYNSNPAAVEAMVVALDLAPQGRRVAFLGDMLELGSSAEALHRSTGERIASRLDLLVAVGPLGPALLDGARAGGLAPEAVIACADSDAAAAVARERVRPYDAVLVKGSRGIHMEAVADALRATFGEVRG